MTTRLIHAGRVAYLLDYKTAEGFRRVLPKLRALGFPESCIKGQGLREKWDEAAILAWREQRIPAHLRSTKAANTELPAAQQLKIEAELATRAASIGQRVRAIGGRHA